MPAATSKPVSNESPSTLHIDPEVTMGEILRAYPTAKIALFIRYHIGGCTSCSYQLTDTLAEVHQNFHILDSLDEMLDAVRQSAAVEGKIHISQQDLAKVLSRGEDTRIIDARSPNEWNAAHLADAQPISVELTFNALDSWPKETPIIFYSNDGGRSLDKAAYFQAYGFINARSLDGGILAWTGKIESSTLN
ncbi:MAG: rhodanese-like domain-containing protein [Edaphobacter sp.]